MARVHDGHSTLFSGIPSKIFAGRDLLLGVNVVDLRFHKHEHDGDRRHHHIRNLRRGVFLDLIQLGWEFSAR
jgi:hypothetical protein